MSTSTGMTLAEYATVTAAASSKLAEHCAETLKALVADPNGPGWATFWNGTEALRAELAVSEPGAVLVHQAVRAAFYHAKNMGMLAPLEAIQDNGTITGVGTNPPLVWYDPANIPDVVLDFAMADGKLTQAMTDVLNARLNALVNNVIAQAPNGATVANGVVTPDPAPNGQGAAVGTVFATKTPLGGMTIIS